MALLEPCSDMWGTADIVCGDPEVTLAHDCVYVPYAPGQVWGLFDQDGIALRTATDLREGAHLPPDQILPDRFDVGSVDGTGPAGAYIYGGRINPHFGHFLVNTLPRFWNIAQVRSPCTQILCHGPGRPVDWFAVPFIAAIFGLLGLTARDFVTFPAPTRIRGMLIPNTSFEEQIAGYAAYRRLCRAIGDRVRATGPSCSSDQPLYYSKTKLKSAVGLVVNEEELESVLRAAGVKIVHPELLTFEQQIRLMSEHGKIVGTSGSYFHASVFCAPRTITCINVTQQINTNYLIVDRLTGNVSTYLYPPALRVLPPQEGILTARYLPDAASVAEELLSWL